MAAIKVSGLTDVHCHILPYVDDGAENLEEAIQLIHAQIEQGVNTIYCTPHLRYKMFETPQEKIDMQFSRLCEVASSIPNAPKLYLSREYHCDKSLVELLKNGKIRPLRNGTHLLIEFSNRHSKTDIYKYLQLVKSVGLTPVIAHIERYRCFLDEPHFADELCNQGYVLQMNAEAILGKNGFKQKLFCKKQLKRGTISLIASDSHHINYREPNLGKCAMYLKHKLSEEEWNKLFFENPKILEK